MRYTIGFAMLAALVGCSGSKDIAAAAAFSTLAGPDAGPNTDQQCSQGTDRIVLVTKAGHIYRVQPDTGVVDDLGTPSCLPYGAFGVSIDRSGSIWIQPNAGNMQVIDPHTMKCKTLDLKVEVGPMTFVRDPETDSETLYVSEVDILTAIDPASLERTVIGKIETPQPKTPGLSASTRMITGTHDGRLFAVYDGDLGSASIGSIDLHTAAVTPTWPSVHEASSGLYLGGVAWGKDFFLVYTQDDDGTDLSRFDTATGQTSLTRGAVADRPIDIGSSTCATQ